MGRVLRRLALFCVMVMLIAACGGGGDSDKESDAESGRESTAVAASSQSAAEAPTGSTSSTGSTAVRTANPTASPTVTARVINLNDGLLALSDMPSGWQALSTPQRIAPCFWDAPLDTLPRPRSEVRVAYQAPAGADGSEKQTVQHFILVFAPGDAAKLIDTVMSTLKDCSPASGTYGGLNIEAGLGELLVSRGLGDQDVWGQQNVRTRQANVLRTENQFYIERCGDVVSWLQLDASDPNVAAFRPTVADPLIRLADQKLAAVSGP
jgi:hypothetical protein